MKTALKISAIIVLLLTTFTHITMAQNTTFFDFEVTDIHGERLSLSEFKGRKVLVVNTASECGYTGQYEDLQELYAQYGGEDFVVIGFPANNFGGQEPGSNAEIAQFCSSKFAVTFPMMAKISVKGSDVHPVYKWLSNKSENGVDDAAPRWNFHKYLIDAEGRWVASYPSSVKPQDERIINWITTK